MKKQLITLALMLTPLLAQVQPCVWPRCEKVSVQNLGLLQTNGIEPCVWPRCGAV